MPSINWVMVLRRFAYAVLIHTDSCDLFDKIIELLYGHHGKRYIVAYEQKREKYPGNPNRT